MNRTEIEWVKNPDGTQGYTFNPITGCLNHVNGICKGGGFPCYAYRIAHGRTKGMYLKNKRIAGADRNDDVPYIPPKLRLEAEDPFYPRWWESRLNAMRVVARFHGGTYRRRPKGIFVCDMSDLFGQGIPTQWTRTVLAVCRSRESYRFYLLTKQPQNLAQFRPFPPNCWVGVTACNQKMYDNAIGYLSEIEATVKFVSLEPISEPISVHSLKAAGIGWVIVGEQTRPRKAAHLLGVCDIVDECMNVGVPVFLKDNLKQTIYDGGVPKHLCTRVDHGESEFDGLELTLRQEMPNVSRN